MTLEEAKKLVPGQKLTWNTHQRYFEEICGNRVEFVGFEKKYTRDHSPVWNDDCALNSDDLPIIVVKWTVKYSTKYNYGDTGESGFSADFLEICKEKEVA